MTGQCCYPLQGGGNALRLAAFCKLPDWHECSCDHAGLNISSTLLDHTKNQKERAAEAAELHVKQLKSDNADLIQQLQAAKAGEEGAQRQLQQLQGDNHNLKAQLADSRQCNEKFEQRVLRQSKVLAEVDLSKTEANNQLQRATADK